MTRTPRPQRSQRAHRARRTLVAALAGAFAVAGTAVPAAAGGGVLVQAGELNVTSQRTVASYDGTQVQLLMDYELSGTSDTGTGAVLLIGTPTEPTITEATAEDHAALAALDTVSSPTVVEADQWWPDSEFFAGAQAADVVTPATATYVADGTTAVGAPGSEAVLAWLASVGYTVDSGDAIPIRHYADNGWWITAISFTPPVEEGPIDLPLLKITFPSEELVIPLIMGASADGSYTVRTTVLASDRMDRTDLLRGMSTVEYAGAISAADVPDVASWLAPFGGLGWVTTVSQTFSNPSRINQDLRFAESSYGSVSAGEVTELRRRIIWGMPAGLVLTGAGLIVLALLGIGISQFLQRRRDY